MFKVQIYAKVRQAYNIEDKSQRHISREFGLNRRTVQKMLEHSTPPGYERRKGIVSPKLDPHKGTVKLTRNRQKTVVFSKL